MTEKSDNGLIIKSIGGLYNVKTSFGVLECKARGIFRKKNISPCVGDNVKIEEIVENTGMISEIYERKNSIIRPPLANLDCIVFVISTCEPVPNLTLLDKFIAIAEYKKIQCIIAVTKRDIIEDGSFDDIYKNSGAELFEIDYENPKSYQRLYDRLKGTISAFTGNTGVGKSTLLNHLCGGNIKTGEISRKLGRGKHTTRHVELYELQNGGYIADTPGFSTFDTNRYDIIMKEQLADCFREFEPYIGKCRFQDCAHLKEKGCAVTEAVSIGDIPKSRYESYAEMYEEAKNIKEWEINQKE